MAEKKQRKSTKPARKRQWHRPQIKSGRLFESNSLACLKTTTGSMSEECFVAGPGGLQQS
jgi:hypothetical protein